ncbi:hypothetical protein AOLI_G00278360 [Acnodon oligacanthus]
MIPNTVARPTVFPTEQLNFSSTPSPELLPVSRETSRRRDLLFGFRKLSFDIRLDFVHKLSGEPEFIAKPETPQFSFGYVLRQRRTFILNHRVASAIFTVNSVVDRASRCPLSRSSV